jgi:hypothetical protein
VLGASLLGLAESMATSIGEADMEEADMILSLARLYMYCFASSPDGAAVCHQLAGIAAIAVERVPNDLQAGAWYGLQKAQQ